jgi:hypothetical protein
VFTVLFEEPDTYHWYWYGAVPPETVAVTFTEFPAVAVTDVPDDDVTVTVSGLGVAVGVGEDVGADVGAAVGAGVGVEAGFTVIVTELDAGEVNGVEALSVILQVTACEVPAAV